ncbi:MAG: glycosyltransferase [SAR324 cluster bacterium]|uniref:Glycosyltransferase n=1 Tax=SAR324 cluster bacterium TaxID=2024889 RepID=A0A7X9IKG8_9DELT|nr:glycosyltransferase [SAR324 cluster bacterium]
MVISQSSNHDRFTGNVDNCLYKITPAGKIKIFVEGWLLHPNSRVISLRLGSSDENLVFARLVHRPDVAAKIPNIKHALESGFSATFEMNQIPTSKMQITLAATLEDGRTLISKLEVNVHKYENMSERQVIEEKQESSPYGSIKSREDYLNVQSLLYKAFLDSNERIKFPVATTPEVSIIIATFNRAPLSYACLCSLKAQQNTSFEVIIVDNNSSDSTRELLCRLEGVYVIQKKENQHFIVASLEGAKKASGKYLLFLNNDCTLFPGALKAALAVFSEIANVACVGAQLIRPDGRLQEAGSKLFEDGSCAAIGNGEDPLKAEYCLRKDVDFVSGAFLMTPRTIWESLGGFDRLFVPAYYEDVDYCLRAKMAGLRIIYEPNVKVLHPEHGCGDSQVPACLMERNKKKLLNKFPGYFKSNEGKNGLKSEPTEVKNLSKKFILFIDDFVPRREVGQGGPRSEKIIQELACRGFEIGIFALNEEKKEEAEAIGQKLPGLKFCRVIPRGDLLNCLLQEQSNYNVIWVSRPHNMEEISRFRDLYPMLFYNKKVIYDAEAVFAMREVLKLELQKGIKLSDTESGRILSKELSLIRNADLVVSVSKYEAFRFKNFGCDKILVLGHAEENPPEALVSFSDRMGILSVGPILDDEAPNADAFKWFIGNVLPLIDKVYGADYHFFTHAGLIHSKKLKEKESARIRLPGFVPDISPLYLSSRIFVAATRYSAGIPLKVIEAASHGVPCVVTALLAEQLGWKEGADFLVASNAEDFAFKCAMLYRDEKLWNYISNNALDRVSDEYSMATFSSQLNEILQVIS